VKTISSSQTVFVKFVFPLLFFFGFGAGALAMWLGPGVDKRGAPIAPETKWLFAAGGVAGTIIIVLFTSRYKRVRVDSNCLHVSNYRTEIAIPFDQIEDITQKKVGRDNNTITIFFCTPTAFGKHILFFPVGPADSEGVHPVFTELKRVAAQGKAHHTPPITFH
jgi:hypothetical protein